MGPIPLPDEAPSLLIQLAEWEQVDAEKDARLRGVSLAHDAAAQQVARALRGCLDIREGFHGLEITSTSFVGRIDVGLVRIAVGPKLPAMPLSTLLRYAYGLRDISTFHETKVPIEGHGFQDLLVLMLVAEIEELVHRGLARRYVPEAQNLGSPRGRILINEIARTGGLVEARLQCRHFDRTTNWHLNFVLEGGLHMAAEITDDRDLRRRGLRMTEFFGDSHRAHLSGDDIVRAQQQVTRLTAAYIPALTIIRVLHEMLGIGFGPTERENRLPGFLFDMNTFFQRLLSRFLHENLSDIVVDEWQIRNVFAYAPNVNPKRRIAPAPRPDFAILHNNRLDGFLDAKYRDIWNRGLPADWLYQLSVYALSAPNQTSVLLYATTDPTARDEQVEIRQPIKSGTGDSASVICRPVLLQRLAKLVHPETAQSLGGARNALARYLVNPSPGLGPMPGVHQ